jgi:hypothetical protein
MAWLESKWGIQKKDNIVGENKFPTDFKINEASHDILESLVETFTLAALYDIAEDTSFVSYTKKKINNF